MDKSHLDDYPGESYTFSNSELKMICEGLIMVRDIQIKELNRLTSEIVNIRKGKSGDINKHSDLLHVKMILLMNIEENDRMTKEFERYL